MRRRPPRVEAPPLVPAVNRWLSACGLVTIAPHLTYLPRWLALIAALLLAWRLWLDYRQQPTPSRWLLLPLVALGIGGVLLEYRTLLGQEAGVALLVLLMGGKLLEMRARRDAGVVLMLALFLLLTHYFNAETIAVGGWLLLSLTLIVATLLITEAPRLPPRAALSRATRMLLQATPLMLLLFLLFPRVSGPLWGLPQAARQAATGLSDQMSPGSISTLIQSGELAFRARFPGAVPAQDQLYWRGPVLTDFDGRTWRATLVSPRPPPIEIEARQTTVAYEMTLEPHRQRWLLALDMPVQIDTEHRLDANLIALRRQPLRERLRYTARAALDYRVGIADSPALLQSALRLPAINPRARALASEWKTAAANVDAIIAAALQYFRREPFHYTLQPPLLPERDGIDAFLFQTRRGFCEHYAGSFVFLMRAAGIPARVVTGYQGGEVNPVDGYLTVRQSDAHAWAEVWLSGRGWVRVDPTAAVAPSRVERGLSAALGADETVPALLRPNLDWLRTLRFRWEAVNNAWNQWVLGYNADRQRDLLQQLGLPADWRALIGALFGFGGALLLGLSLWLFRRRRPRDPVRRAWDRFLRRLTACGLNVAPWEGPRRIAERVQHERPDLAATVAAAALAFERLHYGTPHTDDLDTLRRCYHRLPRHWSPV